MIPSTTLLPVTIASLAAGEMSKWVFFSSSPVIHAGSPSESHPQEQRPPSEPARKNMSIMPYECLQLLQRYGISPYILHRVLDLRFIVMLKRIKIYTQKKKKGLFKRLKALLRQSKEPNGYFSLWDFPPQSFFLCACQSASRDDTLRPWDYIPRAQVKTLKQWDNILKRSGNISRWKGGILRAR